MYILYRVLCSDLYQKEQLLSTHCVDTIITIYFICVYMESSLFANWPEKNLLWNHCEWLLLGSMGKNVFLFQMNRC